MNPVQIDLLSDLVCPWCYIGRRRLEKALAQIPEVETQIRWQPFELFPQIPVSGVERHAHMARVFGSVGRRPGSTSF
ncbi:DsbA family protein [Larkinella soli]|uniref:DsbA family protein n=1 Tax=Larkinella soli TaxID=1770527 RepID=UPI000FFCC55B|nr:DsbA family protein [Larkinella soli]